MADTSHLEALFKQIRDEKGLHANTAWRVGTALLEIIPFLDGTFAVDTVSETWVTDHFVTKSYFESLFELYDADSKIATNGTIPVDRSKLNIKAMFGFWAEQYISSLGKSAGGNAVGGDLLMEPLRSINTASLGSPSQAGVGIIWNGSRWVYGQTSSGANLSTVWDAMNANTNEQINASHLTNALEGYAKSADLTSYLPLAGGRMANINLVANMNADLLDGLHADAMMQRVNLGSATVDADDIKTAGSHRLGSTGTNFPAAGPDFGQMLVVHGGADTYAQMYFPYSQSKAYLRTGNPGSVTGSWKAWRELAFLDSTVARASRLASDSTRTAWGQTYWSGGQPQSISGSMTGVGSISFGGHNGRFIDNSGIPGFGLNNNTDGWGIYNHHASYEGWPFYISANNNVGIGISSPSYKLHVNGHAFTTRLYLASGVYFEYDSGNGGVRLVGAGLSADTYISALGLSANGSTGDTLMEPLRSINNAGLGTPSQAGVGIIWNGSRWVYGQTSSATGSVTSVALSMPTGFEVTNSPVTNSGTLAVSFASGYSLPTTAKQSAWDAKQDAIDDLATIRSNATKGNTAYGWGNHASAGYLTSTSGTFWGQSWNNGGTINGIMTFSTLGLATSWTDAWTDTNNIKHPWYGYDHRQPNNGVFSTTISDYYGIALHCYGGWIVMQHDTGYVGIGTTAPSCMLDVAGAFRTTGNATVGGSVTAGSSVLAQSIELSFSTPFIDFHYNNTTTDYTSRLVADATGVLRLQSWSALAGFKVGETYDGSYVQIGDVRLVYDRSTTALKVVKSDGSAANLYAAGGVSALGYSAGGTSSGSDSGSVKTYHFTKNTGDSGYWHRLGSFTTNGPSYNLVIEIFGGSGFNGNGHQNARTIVTIKGAQVTSASERVGVSCERFSNGGTYSNSMRVRVRMTSNTVGELWVRFPWQWEYGDYVVYGSYAVWTHNSGISDDTTSAPATSGSKVLQTGPTVYYDYSATVSQETY